jgi:hypothetical protein
MSTLETDSKVAKVELDNDLKTLRCYLDPKIMFTRRPPPLSRDCLLVVESLQLLLALDAELRTARADWNQDRFRRTMRVRVKAVSRTFRRWSQLNPKPLTRLGSLRRRYHANLAGGYVSPLGGEDGVR